MYYHVSLILNTFIFSSFTDACATARGLLKQLQTTEAYFRCVVSRRLFATTDAFATAIQRPTINLAEVLRHKGSVLHELQVFRDQFDVIFDTAVSDAKLMDLDELQLPRKRRLPAKLDSGRGDYFHFTDVRSSCRAQFNEAVDTLIATVRWRLDEQSMQPASTIEQLLINATDSSDVDDELLKAVMRYHPHLNATKLKNDLLLLKEHEIPGIIHQLYFRK